jgi:hypothetical protein
MRKSLILLVASVLLTVSAAVAENPPKTQPRGSNPAASGAKPVPAFLTCDDKNPVFGVLRIPAPGDSTSDKYSIHYSCYPYRCLAALRTCANFCLNDTACSPGTGCEGGQCVPHVDNSNVNVTCSEADPCPKGSTCQSGRCEFIAASCVKVDGEKLPPRMLHRSGVSTDLACDPYWCDSTKAACATKCKTVDDCVEPAACDNNRCIYKLGN